MHKRKNADVNNKKSTSYTQEKTFRLVEKSIEHTPPAKLPSFLQKKIPLRSSFTYHMIHWNFCLQILQSTPSL